ncbi:MAG: tryptophan-rich sensory protein [Candidatus Micrarchaeota archaeon]|nr:tryptophan-rich sensory protein [Candidatus Micrarchaeota archaeon]
MHSRDWIRLIACIALCQVVGNLGAIFTFPALVSWYPSLAKPWFTPPSWAFGPAWITLYTLMGISLYLFWKKGQGTRRKAREFRKGTVLFEVQLLLNLLWSLLFFGLRSPLYGLIGIAVLWVMIAATIIEFNRISRSAALLLVPYILWVTFAMTLNLSIWVLN